MEKVSGQAGWSTPIPDEDEVSGQQGLVQAVAGELVGGGGGEGGGVCGDGGLGVEVVRVVYASYVSAAGGRRFVVG